MAQRARLGSGRSTFLAEPAGFEDATLTAFLNPGAIVFGTQIRFANSLRGDKRTSLRPAMGRGAVLHKRTRYGLSH